MFAEVESVGSPIPLIVDVDGTLIKSDLLLETFFLSISTDAVGIFKRLASLTGGKAAFKRALATGGTVDVATLPYNDDVLTRMREAKADGRPVFIVSASDASLVEAIADHLGFVDGWLGSDGRKNLAGKRKAAALIERFGEGRFDYIGNANVDLEVWPHSRHAIVAGGSANLGRRVEALGKVVDVLPHQHGTLKDWLRLIRVHQYIKNALVFVPVLTSHDLSPEALTAALLAFVAFSLCASSVYLLNDLVDLGADRAHPRKRNRPLASGRIALWHGMLACPVFFVAGFATAMTISPQFMLALGGYYVLTLAYSFLLKRKMLIDAVVLALLYTARVFAGAVAIEAPLSEWLLAFSLFIFMSLALVKRFTELTMILDNNLPDPSNRNYRAADLGVVAALAAASGFNAITVFALYVSSDNVRMLYPHHQILWLICPLLMYWLARIILMANRRLVHDDPIIFAVRDWNSLLAAGLIGVLLLLASW